MRCSKPGLEIRILKQTGVAQHRS